MASSRSGSMDGSDDAAATGRPPPTGVGGTTDGNQGTSDRASHQGTFHRASQPRRPDASDHADVQAMEHSHHSKNSKPYYEKGDERRDDEVGQSSKPYYEKGDERLVNPVPCYEEGTEAPCYEEGGRPSERNVQRRRQRARTGSSSSESPTQHRCCRRRYSREPNQRRSRSRSIVIQPRPKLIARESRNRDRSIGRYRHRTDVRDSPCRETTRRSRSNTRPLVNRHGSTSADERACVSRCTLRRQLRHNSHEKNERATQDRYRSRSPIPYYDKSHRQTLEDRATHLVDSNDGKYLTSNRKRLNAQCSRDFPKKCRRLESPDENNVDDMRAEAGQRIREQQLKDKKLFDSKRKLGHKFQVGDLVSIKRETPSDGKSKKLAVKFQGPYRIIKILPNERFLVEDTPLTRKKGNRRYENVVAIDKLKPWLSFNKDFDSNSESDDSDKN